MEIEIAENTSWAQDEDVAMQKPDAQKNKLQSKGGGGEEGRKAEKRGRGAWRFRLDHKKKPLSINCWYLLLSKYLPKCFLFCSLTYSKSFWASFQSASNEKTVSFDVWIDRINRNTAIGNLENRKWRKYAKKKMTYQSITTLFFERKDDKKLCFDLSATARKSKQRQSKDKAIVAIKYFLKL